MKFLGIDVGTGGTRAVVVDEDGSVVSSCSSPHAPFQSTHIGWAEQVPDDWTNAAIAAIRETLSVNSVNAGDIKAVGFSGQMHGTVFLDKDERVLTPAIIWCDQRTEKQCEDLTDRIGSERLIELVANPALPNFSLPKMLWIRENEIEIWERTKTVLLPKDYLRLRMTGDKATDVADASGTLLLDVRRRRWSDELLDITEIDRQILPNVFESTEITGIISRDFAAASGLGAGTPVVAGAGDNAAGAIGMGITRSGSVSVTIGTSGVVFAVTESPKIDEKGRIHTFCHAIPGRWHNTGVTQAAGLSLKWFRDNFAPGESFSDLSKSAAEIAPGSDGLVWTPYLMGERAPHMDPRTRASFVGLTASHTKAHLVRAILEGVAFSLRDSIEIFRDLDVPVETITLGGGGASSPVWRSIQADVFGHEIQTVEAEEGAAYGAALLAGVGVGHWKSVDEACELAIKIREVVQPDKMSHEVLDEQYRIFKAVYPALKSVIEKIGHKGTGR